MKMNNFIKKLKQQPRQGGVPSNLLAAVGAANQASRTPVAATPAPAAAGVAGAAAAAASQQVQQLAQQLANQMVAEMQQSQILARNGRTFTKFDTVNDVVSNQIEVVTAGVWSDGIASLTTFFTSSTQTNTQRTYYVDVSQKDPAATGSAVQFSLAFGHALGSGSDSQGQLNDAASKAIYSQYRQLLLNPSDTRFTTQGSGSTDYIYVINFKRNRLKERMDPGNFELPLSKINTRTSNATGSVTTAAGVFTLIDDSSIASATLVGSGKVFNIVSGSINSGVYNPTAPVYYGLMYPDYGTLILDGKMMDQQLGFKTVSGSSVEGNNHFVLYHSISGSALTTNPATGDKFSFLARNSEKITSTHYFVRIKNAEYNFSNNPSYVTGSVGQIKEKSFIDDPKTYITTIGLYNNRLELLAVAKLSKPLLKSFQREALIRVKLDF
jgi:hypothetical protein